MKTFDINTFNLKKNNLKEYSFSLNEKSFVEQREKIDEYIEIITHKDSIFETYNDYYKNGILKSSVKRFPESFVFGILKEYDQKGNITKQTNLEEPYTYNWEKIKEYLKEHDVNDIKKQVIGISRWHDEEETTWTLEFNGTYNNILGRYVITLNGKTGEELEVKLFKGKKALGKTGTIADYKIILKR